MASQNVSSVLSEQTLSINLAEKIDFIEIFGEQDIRLLFLSVGELPPDGSYSRSARVELSDDRALEARLSFNNPWPTLQVLYSDPLTNAETQSQAIEVQATDALADSGLTYVSRPDTEKDWARDGFQSPLVQFWRWLTNSGFKLHPATVTAALSLILIAALLFVRLHVPMVSAAELLHRSTMAEESIAANPQVVLHRTINLEERLPNAGKVIGRHRIEAWQSVAQGIKLRRIYDEQNNLIAGEWSKSDGTSTVYQLGSKPQARTAPDVAAKAILETGELWRLDATAKNFGMLVERAEAIAVEEKPDSYVLTYQSEAATGASKLLRADLTLNKSDLHAIEQTLTVQSEGEVREFRFTEVGFGQTSTSSITPSMFQPESELLGAEPGPKSNPTSVESLPETSAAGPAEAVASRELEIEVTYLLDRIQANLGEQVSMTRTTGGALLVDALVETEGRKGEILRALGPIVNNPAAKINVRTVSEAMKRKEKQTASRELTVREVEVGNNRMPADNELRAYFASRLIGNEAIDREIGRYAGRVMGLSRQALLQASALKSLLDRFSPEEMRALSPDARAKWVAMIREHTQSYRREVGALRQELRPIFSPSANAADETASSADPVRSAERLLQLSYTSDDAVRSAFTISADGRTTAGIKSEKFWRSLLSAEKLAAAIQRAYQE
jgi:hypothetical protein